MCALYDQSSLQYIESVHRSESVSLIGSTALFPVTFPESIVNLSTFLLFFAFQSFRCYVSTISNDALYLFPFSRGSRPHYTPIPMHYTIVLSFPNIVNDKKRSLFS